MFSKFSKIHDSVVDARKLDIYHSAKLAAMVQRMRKVWLDVLRRSIYHYRKAAATSMLDRVFKGSI